MAQSTNDRDAVPPNALAVFTLVLGIAGLVLSIVVVGGFFGLIAVWVGLIAVTQPEGRKGMAGIGLGMGGISLPIAFMALFFWLYYFQSLHYRGLAQRTWTIAEISNVKTALEAFQTDIGRYPTTPEGLQALVTHPTSVGAAWRGPYWERLPADKWGHPLVYRCPGTFNPAGFDLLSVGPDGIEGTSDDISTQTEPYSP